MRCGVSGAVIALCVCAPCIAPVPVAAAQPGDTSRAAEPPRFEVPAAAEGRPTEFVVYGDTRFTPQTGEMANPTARSALIEGIVRERPRAIFIAGDIPYKGSHAEDYQVYRRDTSPWTSARIPVFPTLGNHEFMDACDADSPYSACLENWWNAFPELNLRPFRWYSVSIGGVLLAIMLDSESDLGETSPQRQWLQTQLCAVGRHVKFVMILLHHPPVRDLHPVREGSASAANARRDGLNPAQNAAYVRDALSATPCRRATFVVVASHVHNYERIVEGGTTYLVSGGGGAKPSKIDQRHPRDQFKLPYSQLNFHYLRFVLQGDTLHGTMVRFDASPEATARWSEPDSFTLTSPAGH